LGSQVFVYEGGDASGSTWQAMGFHPTRRRGARNATTALLERIEGAPDVMDAIRDRLKPGTVLVTTDAPASPDTRSAKDFVVMDSPEDLAAATLSFSLYSPCTVLHWQQEEVMPCQYEPSR